MHDTQIYAFRLRTDQGLKTGRVEALDHRHAQTQAILAAQCIVYGGNITLLKNQDKARKQNYVPVKTVRSI